MALYIRIQKLNKYEEIFIMKKIFFILLCLMLASLSACKHIDLPKETITTAIAQTKFEYESKPDDPFSPVIEDAAVERGIIWLDYYNLREDYVLYDTDGNGTMALLLGWENPYGQVKEIYTFQNGVIERKLSANDPGAEETMIKMLKTGYICTEKLNGMGTNGYYCFEDGQLKLVAGLGVDDHGYFRVDPTGEKRDYFFDFIPDGTEVRVVEEEARRLAEGFWGDGQTVELDWKPLAEYGR